MGDLEHQPEAPSQALRQLLDAELQNPDVLAFLDVNRARLWDAGASDASDAEPRPDPFLALKRDGSRTVLRRAHLILVAAGVQKSAFHAACRPMSGLRPRAPCKSDVARFAAVSRVWRAAQGLQVPWKRLPALE